jgi:hypothetical protein
MKYIAKGSIVDNFDYKLENTPCSDVADNTLCCYQSHVTKRSIAYFCF